MSREYDKIKGDIYLKISEPSNKNDDTIYEQVIQTLTKLPDEIIDNVIQKVYFDLMGVYGKYMKFESGYNGDRHYIFLNSIGLNDKDKNEIQAVIAHEIAHYVKGHHNINLNKLPQEIEDEADELAISWGFDKKAMEKLKNDFHQIFYFDCENCGKCVNFEFTYLYRPESKRICHRCLKNLIKDSEIDDKLLPHDKMRFEYNDKKN